MSVQELGKFSSAILEIDLGIVILGRFRAALCPRVCAEALQNTAADAAQALRPLAGNAAGLLFAAGVVGVGFLAVPVMTIGAAFDICQSFGWRSGLQAKPGQAKPFYAAIVLFTIAAIGLNFFGINPMKALVYAGVVQGVSTPFLMLLIMLATNNRKIMGRWVNKRPMNILGWFTVAAMFAATLGLLITLAK